MSEYKVPKVWEWNEEKNQFDSDFIKINPNSKIPIMVDYSHEEPVCVFESVSILLYLAEKELIAWDESTIADMTICHGMVDSFKDTSSWLCSWTFKCQRIHGFKSMGSSLSERPAVHRALEVEHKETN